SLLSSKVAGTVCPVHRLWGDERASPGPFLPAGNLPLPGKLKERCAPRRTAHFFWVVWVWRLTLGADGALTPRSQKGGQGMGPDAGRAIDATVAIPLRRSGGASARSPGLPEFLGNRGGGPMGRIHRGWARCPCAESLRGGSRRDTPQVP